MKNSKKINIFFTIFFASLFFISLKNNVKAEIRPYDQNCNSDADCSVGCCMVDIYGDNSVLEYYRCVANNPNTWSTSCIKRNTSTKNKCWPKEVCSKGLAYAVVINGQCGEITGMESISRTQITSITNSSFCSAGSFSGYELNENTNKYQWTCDGYYGGTNVSCSIAVNTNNVTTPVSATKIKGVCGTFSSAVTEKPTSNLCVVGTAGAVSINPEDKKFVWDCNGKNGGDSVSCDVDYIDNTKSSVKAEQDEYKAIESIVTNKIQEETQTSSGVVSNYKTIQQTSSNSNNYKLLENYKSECTILFNSECETIDDGLYNAITEKLTIQEAVKKGYMNGKFYVAYIDTSENTPKEKDTYKTGYTLSNIQKLRKARVFPVGFELAAMCITGQIECADGVIYDVKGEQTYYKEESCSAISGTTYYTCNNSTVRHKQMMDKVTLNDLIEGYSSPSSPFYHLLNKDWVLKNPGYICESGNVNSAILTSTVNTNGSSNIRYTSCPDISSCLKEKDNGDCLEYGYCLREGNVWRFSSAATSCLKDNVGCTKYSYTVGGTTTTVGFIKNTTDTSVCDTSNSGCRKYSTVKTGNSSDNWSYNENNKIYLNGNISMCDASNDGCTAFIRRDTANLIKNSSFEDYDVSNNDPTNKKLEDWIFVTNQADAVSYTLQGLSNSIPTQDGENALSLSISNPSAYAAIHLSKNNLISVQPNKTYTLSYYIAGYNFNFTSGELNNSHGAYVNIKEYSNNKTLLGTDSLYNIDKEAFKYVSTYISSSYTRKIVTFKTGINTYYLDIIPTIAMVSVKSGSKATVVFDALQLQEGSDATEYNTYENSEKIYLKKAPSYSNCYSSSSNKDEIYCSNYIKQCEEKDVGCRKYTKVENNEYWLPGKPNENNYCPAECKGYFLYRESGPSYDPKNGESISSFIERTAKTCSSSEAGCSKYQKITTDNSVEYEYYSTIRACVKEDVNIGICSSGTLAGNYCNTDADCGNNGECRNKTEVSQYVDYFTYTGSETSGYKLNVYRLLRTKVCSGKTTKKCNSNSDCTGTEGSCGYIDEQYAPATIKSTSFDRCDENEYKKKNHNPDCIEFHGPKNKASAQGDSTGGYILYYTKMSEVIFVSNNDCEYYTIVPNQGMIDTDYCDEISYLPSEIRYNNLLGTCNVGVYLPDSSTCMESSLNCREYNGTSSLSEILFEDNFEEGNDEWNKCIGDCREMESGVTISTESLFMGEHSLKLNANSKIKKSLENFVETTENAVYKIKVYIKNSSTSGASSTITLKAGESFRSVKNISNEWKLMNFDIFTNSDLLKENAITFINDSNEDIYLDYITLEKSSSVYVIKDSWTTPVSCDNSLDNATGVCTTEYEELGYCSKTPQKICFKGDADMLGMNCSSDYECGSNGSCKEKDMVCKRGDREGASCFDDSDCYNSFESMDETSYGACAYADYGNRLELGKMIGCDEYVDSYKNNGFFVFNDLNLCNSESMGCEALYDTKNSKSAKKQIFNDNSDYYGIVAKYTFDEKDNIAIDDYSLKALTNRANTGSAVSYVSDGKVLGAASFSGNNYLEEDGKMSDFSTISIYAWIRPGSYRTDKEQYIISSYKGNSITASGVSLYDFYLDKAGKLVCKIGNDNIKNRATATAEFKGKYDNKEWNNVLCTFDGDKVKIYINGEYVAGSVANGSYVGNGSSKEKLDVIISFNKNDEIHNRIGSQFKGEIDEIRIYNKMFDSKDAYVAYSDSFDNYVVEADELGYYIINDRYLCDSIYKGCSALGRNDDRYDSKDSSYSTIYAVVDPDKFESSGEYNTTGVYNATMCKVEEEGCYTFKNESNAVVNFKYPKNICVYQTNVDIGVIDPNTQLSIIKDGWFKFDKKNNVVSNEGCYLEQMINSGIGVNEAKQSDDSYIIRSSSECEYRNEPVVVRRSFEKVCSNNSTTICTKDTDCVGSGVCNNYITLPKQTTYYIFEGTCSGNRMASCYSDSDCDSGYCVLERTSKSCSPDSNTPGCMPYGYDENPGIIDEYTNNTFNGEFNICISGNNIGRYCSLDSECNGGKCGEPWTVIGWFKKNSTEGCSDNGNGIIEASDYRNTYNGSVGVCNEYGCTSFIEPSEKTCTAGNLNGYTCESDNNCGENGRCVTDQRNGKKYCIIKENTTSKIYRTNNSCGVCPNSQECIDGYCQERVTKIGSSCVSDSDCGFGGVCTGNNVYSYIDDSKIDTSSCNGKVSRESGCILFNKTSDDTLKYSSQATYANVKKSSGKQVSPVVGDNSGGINQKDANIIIKVTRDRECAEWLVFNKTGNSNTGSNNSENVYIGTATISEFDADNNGGKVTLATCIEMSEDKRCLEWGNGYNNNLTTSFYVGQMTGEWSNRDFSGFSIPNKKDLTKKEGTKNWWIDSDNSKDVAGSTSIFAANYNEAKSKICKSYPETDSPYNFSDKYEVKLYECKFNGNEIVDIGEVISFSRDSIGNTPYILNDINKGKVTHTSGYDEWCFKMESGEYSKVLTYKGKVVALTYNQYKELAPREYFKTVKTGITIPYTKTGKGVDDKSLIWIDDDQECYYQKVSYNDYTDPTEQYYGSSVGLPQNVCYSNSINIDSSDNTCNGIGTSKKKTDYNNTIQSVYSDYRQGYCLEYDYSKEIFYTGSGKFNCITWIPGYIK